MLLLARSHTYTEGAIGNTLLRVANCYELLSLLLRTWYGRTAVYNTSLGVVAVHQCGVRECHDVQHCRSAIFNFLALHLRLPIEPNDF